MPYQILLVEDDPQIAEVIRHYFSRRSEEYELDCAKDGLEGLDSIQKKSYDMILLDVMLPGRNGFSLIREIRKKLDTPVIFLTAKVREEDRLKGYELGCDDYVCKPFSLAELYAKINALMKRSKGLVVSEELTCGDITVHKQLHEVRVKGKKIELMPKDLELLLVLMEHTNWVFSREMLLDRVWGYDYDGLDRTVDNHIKRLRKALGSAGRQIQTVYCVGYKFTEEKKEEG